MSEKKSFVLRWVPISKFSCIYFYLNVHEYTDIHICISQLCALLNGSRHQKIRMKHIYIRTAGHPKAMKKEQKIKLCQHDLPDPHKHGDL